MSNGIFGIGLSALQTSQAGLRVASQNIANANTAGYVRAEVQQTATIIGGQGGGVEVEGITRAANQFLARATHDASGRQAATAARADFWSRAQAEFGDPTGASSLFAKLDSLWTSMSNTAVDPSSPSRRAETVDALDAALATVSTASLAVQALAQEADSRLSEAVGRAQSLIGAISDLNTQIGITSSIAGDTTGPQNAQSAMIDELATLLDVRVSARHNGTVELRTGSGALLVGDGASNLSHTQMAGLFARYNPVELTDSTGAGYPLDPYIKGGEIRGLLDARDIDLKALSESLGSLAATLTDTLNAVHAENTSSPPLQVLTGRNTGLIETDSLNFTGKAQIGVVLPDETLANRITIDFDAGTITSEEPPSVISFVNRIGDNALPDTSFVEALNTALAAAGGSASFEDGVLTLSGASRGLVVQQDPDDPSSRAGRGFSHFFGLNDLARREEPAFFEAGAQATDTHGLVAGGEFIVKVRDGLGREVANRTLTITGPLAAPTSTWADIAAAFNAPGTGIGEYGAMTFDATGGRLSLQSFGGFQVAFTSDTTSRGDTGLSMATVFGLTDASRESRAIEVSVRPDIMSNPSRLALARPDLANAVLTERLVEQGDAKGAAALVAARDTTRAMPSSGIMAAQTTSIGLYATRLGGEIGRRAQQADRDSAAADAVANAASERRSATEGVSLDDELISLTTYQQSYAAAARVIQAATEMFDLLLRLGA
jgi:flagellar hook-associated protein 1